jgi:hypothetical protein
MAKDDPLGDLPWPDPVEPRAAVSDCIRQHCTKDLCRRRGMSAGRRVAASLLLSAITVAALTGLAAQNRPQETLRSAVLGAMGWAIVQTAVLMVGLARPAGRRYSPFARASLAVVVPIAFLVYLAFASRSHVPAQVFAGGQHAARALGCGVHALVVGAIVAGGMLLIWRGTDPSTPGLSGAIAGLVGGIGTAIAVGVVCPTEDTWHLWLAHGGTLIAMMALAALAGRRWLTP